VLLLGLPGTGKTSTLSLVVRALMARGQTVMITSYTHSAVDNLLLKLLESNISSSFIVRLGGTDPKTAECILSKKSVSAISELRSKVTSARLIACTVLTAARHNLMNKFKIDSCIVDEAGQIAQPAVLGAIMRAKKFILVGDDCQLPPLVLSPQAATEGMDVSQLKRLSESHPEAISCLSIQYRMNEDIMFLCNSIVYEYKMLCGSPLIANARLQLPNLHGIIQKLSTCQSNSWLVQCLQPQNSVIFLNTDNMRSINVSETIDTHSNSNNCINLDEVNLIKSIFKCFIDCGADEKDIGIISPFRAQVEVLNEQLKDLIPRKEMSQLSNDNGDCCVGCCDISTVDKFQGRDKDIIVLSTVRSMNDRSVGDLLRDWRRVNVALTRSRKKLIITGSLQIMERIPVLSKLRKLLLEKNWVINMT
jgi:DNA replication ATP-dependent helicase Dna2